MASQPVTWGLSMAGMLLVFGSFGELVPPVSAIPLQAKKETKPTVVRPGRSDEPGSPSTSKGKVGKPPRKRSGKSVAADSKESAKGHASQKPRRHKKKKNAGGKGLPSNIVKSKTDLSHYGMLEEPRRYDPRLDRRTGLARHPKIEALLHDHFQELDRNRDGRIDPFERAMGRLDIERDLPNRQRE